MLPKQLSALSLLTSCFASFHMLRFSIFGGGGLDCTPPFTPDGCSHLHRNPNSSWPHHVHMYTVFVCVCVEMFHIAKKISTSHAGAP